MCILPRNSMKAGDSEVCVVVHNNGNFSISHMPDFNATLNSIGGLVQIGSYIYLISQRAVLCYCFYLEELLVL